MRTPLLTTLGILALCASTFAAPAKPRQTWAAGQLERFDPSSKTVVVKQGTHEMTFVLASDARLMQGKTTLQANDLTTDVGRQVKVRYTKNASTLTADRIEVAAPAPVKASASAKTTTSTKNAPAKK